MSRRAGTPAAAIAAGTLVALAVVVVAAPLPVVLGANRLVGYAVAAAGAWFLVGRVGAVDLATGAGVGAGAYLGGVLAALLELPPVLGLLTGTAAGSVVSATNAAIAGRVGRTAGALTSLALGGAVVALLRSWSAAGGVAGFHAVPLLTGSDRGDLAAALLLLGAGALVVTHEAGSRRGARAAVAIASPPLAASLGRRPVVDTAVAGAIAGAVLGLAGALQSFLVGSVAPDAYGLGLSAALALAALLGGRAPLGPLLGALLLWAPSVVWPLAPVVGDGPVLLATGIAGLAVLVLRRGRPLLRPRHPTDGADATADDTDQADPERPPGPSRRVALAVRGARLPGGTVTLRVEPGEVVLLSGPNGAGKSTLLARVAGQLPDDGAIVLGGDAPPAGALARARAGVGRTWQRPPAVDLDDAALVARSTSEDPAGAAAAERWARHVLGDVAGTPAGGQLVRLAARRPAVALLDEPAAALDVDLVGRFVQGLAVAGAAVLVVEHRAEAATFADRVVAIDAGGGT
ncbi:MAG: ATP-binding cassette domain-containing protein [Actinobacteria bacterium]|nr:ATP-binding cassette domain-containing protein [Actinomycetota bacterium]